MDLTLAPGALAEWPAAVFQSVVTSLLAVVFWAMYRRVQKEYLAWWAATWTLYAVRMGAILAFIGTERPIWLFWHQVLTGWTALALLGAAVAFSRPTEPLARWRWLALFPVAWSYVAIYQLDSFLLAAGPAVVFLSLATALAAAAFRYHTRRVASPAALFLTWALALWALHHLDYPFLRARGAWAPWGYYLDLLFQGGTAFGILVLVMEDYRLGLHSLSRLAAQVVRPERGQELIRGILTELCRLPGVNGAALFAPGKGGPGESPSQRRIVGVGSLSDRDASFLTRAATSGQISGRTDMVLRFPAPPDRRGADEGAMTWIPVPMPDGAWGGLAVAGGGRHGLVAVGDEYLVAMGQHLGTALTRADLDERLTARTRELEEVAALAVGQHEQERKRLSRELHDETAQALAAVRMRLALAKEELGEAASPTLDEAVEVLQVAIAGIRRVTSRLRPQVLDELGLVPALRALTREFGRTSGLQVSFEQGGPVTGLDAERELVMFRALQEGLSNVARHAPGSEARVFLSRQDGMIELRVEDQGAAAEQGEARTGDPGTEGATPAASEFGAGLTGMRERVAGVGGSVVFTRSSGGARLTVQVPTEEVPA